VCVCDLIHLHSHPHTHAHTHSRTRRSVKDDDLMVFDSYDLVKPPIVPGGSFIAASYILTTNQTRVSAYVYVFVYVNVCVCV
jgi:hypothetical protein